MQKVLVFVFKQREDLMFHPDRDREEESSALGCLALPPEVALLSQILLETSGSTAGLERLVCFGV